MALGVLIGFLEEGGVGGAIGLGVWYFGVNNLGEDEIGSSCSSMIMASCFQCDGELPLHVV